ncbi:MAG: FAD-binding oxidoreductase [Deltaproteobacteria bacterium]|nr:FAD-binding oxidoreductase [Deltaproteobacteria bacterium]
MPELPQRASVVIIGGGFAGAATAWALRRAGVSDVIVLEREMALGRYASGRSAGLGRQLAEDDHTTALTVRGAQLIREMKGDVWRPTGGILSFDSAELADAYVERAQRFGVPVEVGDRAAVQGRWPVGELKIAKALYVASDGTIDVTQLLRELVKKTRVEVSCGVERIEPHRVITTKGAIEAQVIVDATGAWAGGLTGDEPLLLYKRHVFIIENESEPGPWLWHLGAGEMYMRHDGEGVLMSPCDAARSEPGHQEPDLVGEAHVRKLLEDAEMPLANAIITRRWACQRAFRPDRKMRLGRDDQRPWLVWAAGLGGHGATAAPAVGEAVAAAVVERLQSGQ